MLVVGLKTEAILKRNCNFPLDELREPPSEAAQTSDF